MCITNDSCNNQQTGLMCFPSNEKDPCTDSGSLSGRQVPGVSQRLRKHITTISNVSSYSLQIVHIFGEIDRKGLVQYYGEKDL